MTSQGHHGHGRPHALERRVDQGLAEDAGIRILNGFLQLYRCCITKVLEIISYRFYGRLAGDFTAYIAAHTVGYGQYVFSWLI